jgi:Ca2+-binding RTX toxin-like protein
MEPTPNDNFQPELLTEDPGFEDQIIPNDEDFFLMFDPQSVGFTGSQQPALTIRLADGSALPDWFQFDPIGGTLSGLAPTGFRGVVNLVATASDGINSVDKSFDLTFAQSFEGSAGDDDLDGTDDSDVFDGGLGNDIIDGGLGDDEIMGEEGDDSLMGGFGDDQLFGGWGDDSLTGDEGNDDIWGDEGDDQLRGGLGDDTLEGGVGNDKLMGETGNDRLIGNEGNDQLLGGIGNDDLFGGDGNDQLTGGTGNDNLIGGNGKDQLVGNNGNDVLMGGTGRDRLTGGGGHDIFVLSSGTGSTTILDFRKKIDKLGLSGGIKFSDLQITHARGNTLITLGKTHDLLASLQGNVRLTAANFTTNLPTTLSLDL